MNSILPLLMVDCSVAVKWKFLSEPHAPEAREMFLDWQAGACTVCAPDQIFVELTSAFLGASRGKSPRLTVNEAKEAIEHIASLPFVIFRTRSKKSLQRALEIAHQFNQRAYDCIYVALAERKKVEFWTGDQRLYNALHQHFRFLRWIGDYQRKRPEE